MGPFEWKDDVIYDELRSQVPGAAVEKGDGAVRQDVFGFWAADVTAAEIALSRTCAFIYRCRQVKAAKKTGSGEAIVAGDRLYYIVADEAVTKNKPVSGYGTTYYFCGWAKDDATAAATTVLMNFDGTQQDKDV